LATDIATSGVVSFAPGEVDKIVTVQVIGDTILDGTETFLMNLTTPANATLARAQAVGTILDDDAVSEARMTQAVSAGSARLHALQRIDGGWFFMVGDTDCRAGAGVSCRNTVGNTALGLLAGYTSTGDASLLTAAAAAGDYLVTLYRAAIAKSPPTRPFDQDIEFLVALGSLTGNALYTSTAASWFQVVVDQFPNAADRIDLMVASRDAQHLRSLAAWDAASFIRAAKAAGNVNYALAAAARIRDREADWKDTNPRTGRSVSEHGRMRPWTTVSPSHRSRSDRGGRLARARADRRLRGGPMATLWFLLVAFMLTAYVVLGLAAVGGPGTSNAILSASAFSLGTQLTAGGWPSAVTNGGLGSEYTLVDAEIVRAIATLFNTPVGSNVAVAPAQLSSVTFSTVSTSGLTSVVAGEYPTAVPVPSGFEVIRGLDYKVVTTATVAGDTVACFLVPWIADAATFASVRVLHEERGVFVDRTILTPGQPAPRFATRQVCARVSSLTTFALALRDVTPPDLKVTLSPSVLSPADHRMVTVTAAITVTDDHDPAPRVTLLSITSSERDHEQDRT
jgi:hypothetical protein